MSINLGDNAEYGTPPTYDQSQQIKSVLGLGNVEDVALSTWTGSENLSLSASQVADFDSSASDAAPVQSVAGRTGSVSLSASDISDPENIVTSGNVAAVLPAAHTAAGLDTITRTLVEGAPNIPETLVLSGSLTATLTHVSGSQLELKYSNTGVAYGAEAPAGVYLEYVVDRWTVYKKPTGEEPPGTVVKTSDITTDPPQECTWGDTGLVVTGATLTATHIGQWCRVETATADVYDWWQWNGDEWVFVRTDGQALNSLNPIAVGYENIASDSNSTAVGYSNLASNSNASAVGFNNDASGDSSTAVGSYNTASGYISSAVGYNNTASGDYSSAVGYNNTASGDYSSAFGFNNEASGHYSSAIGYQSKTTVSNTQEFGYWSSTTTRNGAVRVHGTGMVAMTLQDRSTKYDVGSTTNGSEADNTLAVNMFAIRRDGTNIYIDVNIGGVVRSSAAIATT